MVNVMFYTVKKGTNLFSHDSIVFQSSSLDTCKRFLKDGDVICQLSMKGSNHIFVPV